MWLPRACPPIARMKVNEIPQKSFDQALSLDRSQLVPRWKHSILSWVGAHHHHSIRQKVTPCGLSFEEPQLIYAPASVCQVELRFFGYIFIYFLAKIFIFINVGSVMLFPCREKETCSSQHSCCFLSLSSLF